ncbi:MAG: Hsp70 family protein [Oligoflexia bacterium]|nr:Hsp70 family protein [Oligoflexia bacterium]
MAKVVGIDLGTSNSSIGIRELTTRILKSSEGDFIVPSCVAFTERETLVGVKAKNQSKQNAERTVVHVKRLMGKTLIDQEVQSIISKSRYAYKIAQHSSSALSTLAIQIPPREFTPEEISSLILGKVKRDAEAALGEEVTHAVITVPAYYNDRQKNATLSAAKLANLHVLRLLPEPTAAALSFGIDDQKATLAETMIVFDFGGGTLDISILTIGGENIIEQAKGGDMWLGGVDLDRVTAELILEKAKVSRSSKQYAKALSNLLPHAEAAKIALSANPKVKIQIVELYEDEDGFPVGLDVEVTEQEFSQKIRPILEKIKPLVNNLLQDVHFSPLDISKILLVGGSSQIPLVKRLLAEIFPLEKIILHDRPMLAIAEGASILAHKLMGQTEVMGEIVYTTAHEYYLVDSDAKRHLLIGKNLPLPAQTTLVATLKKGAEQRLVHFPFENRVDGRFEKIGDLWLSFDLDDREQDNEKRDIAIHLAVSIDENNLLQVEACLKDYPSIKIKRNLSRGMVDEALFQRLEKDLAEVSTIPSCYVGYDYEERVKSIVTNINEIIDAETLAINQEKENKAKHQLDLAIQLARNDQPLYTNYWYVKDALEDFQDEHPSQKVEEIKQIKVILKSFEKMLEHASYDELIAKKEELFSEIERLLPNLQSGSMMKEEIFIWAEKTGRLDLLEKMSTLAEKSERATTEKERAKFDDKIRDTVQELRDLYEKRSHRIETGFRL